MTFSYSVFTQTSAKTADFLIVEKPSNLLIYNKYQQQVSFREQRSIFTNFRPLLVEKEKTLLSDNFTNAMQIRLNRDTYFLIKTEADVFENNTDLGYYALFQNCAVLNDTIEILRDQSIFISKRPTTRATAEAQKEFLAKGTQVKRLFQHKNFTYVEIIANRPEYGWANLSRSTAGSNWEILKNSTATPIKQDDLQIIAQKTQRRISEVNSLLNQLFAYFNQETGKQHPPPMWEMDISESKITCSLINADYQTEFSESSRYLINSLENFVLGTPYAVFAQNDAIEIRKR